MMHDLSTSQLIFKTVIKEAKNEEAKKILSLQIELGQLTLLSPQQVRFWLKELLKGTIGERARIYIRKVPSRVRCQGCGYEGRMSLEEDPLYHFYFPTLRCPRCHSASLKIEKGRECSLRKITLTH